MDLSGFIKLIFKLLAIYLLFDGLLHLFNIRLNDVINIWPNDAVSFSGFLSQIYASFVILTAFLVWEIQKELKKNQALILIIGIWLVCHGGYLIYQTLSGFYLNFASAASLVVWLPFYPVITFLEGIGGLLFGTIVFLWRYKYGKNS